MIEFAKITQTLGGIDCCYLGKRSSGDQVLHRFAITNPTCETFAYFNDQGQRIEYVAPGKWAVTLDGHQIVKPPKIIEVTRWVALYGGNGSDDGFFVCTYRQEPGKAADNTPDLLCKFQHTFRFEVPNE